MPELQILYHVCALLKILYNPRKVLLRYAERKDVYSALLNSYGLVQSASYEG